MSKNEDNNSSFKEISEERNIKGNENSAYIDALCAGTVPKLDLNLENLINAGSYSLN